MSRVLLYLIGLYSELYKDVESIYNSAWTQVYFCAIIIIIDLFCGINPELNLED